VAIPALNELYSIPKTIESIKNQVTDFDYEIVVADNGSTDGTREYLSNLDGVKLVKADKKGISIARNAAARAASASYIIQTDADVVVPEDWIQRMGEKMINDGQDIVAGSVAFDSDNRLHRWITSTIYGMGLRIYNGVQGILPIDLGRIHSGANLGFSKKIFDDVGGYDEDQKWFESGDFTSEAQKLGAKIKFVPGTPVTTSNRRFGDTLISTAARLAHTGSVSLLKMMGIEHEVDYDRVD
jgi:glycosyltransferase involved in cell wall biosynthesis